MNTKKKKIMLVSSAGGHLNQILELEPLFMKYDYVIVTENLPFYKELNLRYNIEFVKPGGKGRNIVFWYNFISNIILSFKLIIKHKPDVIITTGSHTAVSFCYIGKLINAKVIYILSYAKINSKAKAADLIHPIADHFIVQWESAKKLYSKSIYLGGGLY